MRTQTFQVLFRFGTKPKVTTETLKEVDELSGLSDDEEISAFGRTNSTTVNSESPSDSAILLRAEAASADRKQRGAPSSGSTTTSARKKKKAKAVDPEVAFMESYRDDQRLELTERARHHRRMEEIEEKKLLAEEQKAQWKSKQDELTYKRQLFTTKKELESEGHSKAEILALLPELAPLYSHDEP